MGFSRWLLVLTFGLVVATGCIASVGAAEADVPDSRDPYGVERFPRSWIVEYEQDEEVRPRRLVLGRVDSIRRELQVGDELQLNARVETVTYRIPDGATVSEVVEHYRRELGADALFRCEGRGCGRSNDWANQVFGQATLYGPDKNQYYSAREWQNRFVSLYVIERGNRRVYAHLQFFEPQGPLPAEQAGALLVSRLGERGWAPVTAVRASARGDSISARGDLKSARGDLKNARGDLKNARGDLKNARGDLKNARGDGFDFSDETQAILAGLAEQLEPFAGKRLYVVCHLNAPEPVETLLTASQRCAEAAVERIASGDAANLNLEAFGAGPLLPRSEADGSRLELVLPEVLRR